MQALIGIIPFTYIYDKKNVKIETPLQEKRIGAVFRGDGPMGAARGEWNSFDRYLHDLCVEKGANVIIDNNYYPVEEGKYSDNYWR